MAYGKVPDVFWSQVRSLSEDARLVELYLRTGPHRKRLGIGVMDPYYVLADLAWADVSRVSTALAELRDAGRIRWDEEHRVVFVPDALRTDPPLRNEQAVRGAIADLSSLPETALIEDLFGVVKSLLEPEKPHHALLLEAVSRRLRVSGTTGNEPPESPTIPPVSEPIDERGDERGVERIVERNVERSTIPAPSLPAQSTSVHNTPAPAQAHLTGRDVEHGSEAWKAIKGVVLEKWHLGSEQIPVPGGKSIGMGAELENVLQLVKAHGVEETLGAITVGPTLFGFTEPHSLRWYTSKEHGPSNFNNAVGQWRKGEFPEPERNGGPRPVHVE